jgi:putative ABC transport system ATP-binding protein
MNVDDINAVVCRDVTKTFHSGDVDTMALRGINLEVRAGELFMLVGPSGCGKTTLISIIAGILNNDSGECLIFGESLVKMKERERTRVRGRTLGFVFQSFNLIPTLSAKENVAIPLLLQQVPYEDALQKAAKLLARVGLEHKANTLPRELSGGQQQRVAIARALVHDPKLIVCDEPTSALDQDTGRHIMEIFQEISVVDRKTMIIVTHDSRIINFGHRIAHMNDGIVEKIMNGTGFNIAGGSDV